MTKSNLKGFTLIELLIVIVIIGILAVALIPRLTGAQATARDTARQASLQQIATALTLWKNENPGSSAVTNMSTFKTAAFSTYANDLPEDPKTGLDFTLTGDMTNGYVICATVEKTTKGNAASCPSTPAAITGFVASTSGAVYVVKVS